MSFKDMKLLRDEDFSKEAEMPLLIRMQIKHVNKKWSRCGRSFSVDDYYKLHNTYWKSRSSVILTHHFTKDELDILHDKCSKENISVNSIITAAFLKADTSNVTVGMAVNIRKDNDYSMSNQVSGLSIKMKYNNRKSVMDNAAIFQKKLCKILKRPSMKYFVLKFMAMLSPTITDSVLMNVYGLYNNTISYKMAGAMGYKRRKKCDIGITDLTKLDIASIYGRYAIKNFMFIPPAISYADHVIGIASMDDGMNITYHFMSDKDYNKEKEFFERAVENIRNVMSD